MKVLRTDDKHFANLPGFPFTPNYLEVGSDLRMHYVDEGPKDARVVLMLHGEPTWSYLYRHMIPPIAAAGLRAMAPDLIGFGRSDKPAARSDYSYAAQVEWVWRWMQKLNLKRVTLVCQDWGSLIGLRLAAEHPEVFDQVILSNGGLPTGDGKAPLPFRLWRAFATHSPWFPVGGIVQAGSKRKLSPEEVAAYNAPFPSAEYKVAVRLYPSLVPITPENPACEANRRAWTVFENWQKPFITCFGDADPITRGLDRAFQTRVPGARNQPHTPLKGGHFIQEDDPQNFAKIAIDACKRLS